MLSQADKLNAALNAAPKTSAAKAADGPAVLAFADLLAKGRDGTLGDYFAKQYVLAEHKTLERGKAVVVFEALKGDRKESIRAFMTRTFGKVDDNAFGVASVFRELVAVDPQTGKAEETAGHARLTEAEFNAIRGEGSTRIILDAAASLGYIAKGTDSDEQKAASREVIAQLLRKFVTEGWAKVKDEAKVVKTALKPEPTEEQKAKKAKKDGEEVEEAKKALLATPESILAMIAAPGGVFFQAIADYATAHPEKALGLAGDLHRVATNAAAVRDSINAAIAPEAKAA